MTTPTCMDLIQTPTIGTTIERGVEETPMVMGPDLAAEKAVRMTQTQDQVAEGEVNMILQDREAGKVASMIQKMIIPDLEAGKAVKMILDPVLVEHCH